MIKHEIKIVFEEYENTSEDFEIFREGFLRFLKDNPLILRENDKYIEDKLRKKFYFQEMLTSYMQCDKCDKEVLEVHTLECIYSDIAEYQRASIDNLFNSNAYKEMLKKARQLFCSAPTNSNE